MKLSVENKQEITVLKFETVEKNLNSLKSYGPHTYAILMDERGNYIQVAGGLFTCFVERFDSKEKKIYRATHAISSTNFEDGSVLVFGGGSVKLNKNNWFNIEDVIKLFNSFFLNEKYPEDIDWELLNNIF